MTEQKRSYKYYNNGLITKKFFDDETIPDGFTLGHLTKMNKTPWNKGLTSKTDARVKKYSDLRTSTMKEKGCYENPWNKGKTKHTDSRIKGLYGEDNPMYGKHPEAWNKGLTKETDSRIKRISEKHTGCQAWNKGLNHTTDSRIKYGYNRFQATKDKISKAHSDPIFIQKRFESMKANKTIGIQKDTQAEKKFYTELLKIYKEDDIIHPHLDIERYPFQCDFYIISEDKFIELHSCWTHGGKPFDENDKECQEKLAVWKQKAKTSKYYQNAIYTWTDLDVRKLETAKKNNLNY